MSVIEVKKLTRDYGHGRGVFDLSFSVEKGEVFGLLGPNGAGKTTTIRHLMGFIKPIFGQVKIDGKDVWGDNELLKKVGYLPGEIALYEGMSVKEFLNYMAALRGVKDFSYTKKLLKQFDFDVKGPIKRMALGNKRKLAIITAFMHDPEILILDEPTSGLDPLMQKRFVDFIKKEKRRGKTILLSSHIFKEVDATCDRLAIVKEGVIVSLVRTKDFENLTDRTYKIEFSNKKDFIAFRKQNFNIILSKEEFNQVRLRTSGEEINQLFFELSKRKVKFVSEIPFTLEDYFLDFYDKNKKVKEGR